MPLGYVRVFPQPSAQVGRESQQVEELDKRVISAYELLAQCIRSDQVPADEVQKIMADAAFKAWYTRKYPA